LFLVTAAGIQRRHSAENFPIEEWDEVMSINFTRYLLCVNWQDGYGKIINVASFFGGQTVLAYLAAKGGVVQLTKEMSNDWVDRGVNVNAVAPSYMATDMSSMRNSLNKGTTRAAACWAARKYQGKVTAKAGRLSRLLLCCGRH
jgi:NAD(P)-dependent dehydrogenase (short-subunit alcohol dehydrogenase family)